MIILPHINSMLNSVCYRINNSLIDPGDVWDGFANIHVVLLSHAHFDHIYGLNDLLKISPDALVYTNEAGREMLLNAKKNMSYYHETPFVIEHPEKIRIVKDGDEVSLDNGMTAKAVFTPGHNPSCITWVIDDMVFTGDSLIPGVKTVTNLPGGDRNTALISEELIKKIAIGRQLYPGHRLDV